MHIYYVYDKYECKEFYDLYYIDAIIRYIINKYKKTSILSLSFLFFKIKWRKKLNTCVVRAEHEND